MDPRHTRHLFDKDPISWDAGTITFRGHRIRVVWETDGYGRFLKWYGEADGGFLCASLPILLNNLREKDAGVGEKYEELDRMPVGARVGDWLKTDHMGEHDYSPWLWVDVTTGHAIGTTALARHLCMPDVYPDVRPQHTTH